MTCYRFLSAHTTQQTKPWTTSTEGDYADPNSEEEKHRPRRILFEKGKTWEMKEDLSCDHIDS